MSLQSLGITWIVMAGLLSACIMLFGVLRQHQRWEDRRPWLACLAGIGAFAGWLYLSVFVLNEPSTGIRIGPAAPASWLTLLAAVLFLAGHLGVTLGLVQRSGQLPRTLISLASLLADLLLGLTAAGLLAQLRGLPLFGQRPDWVLWAYALSPAVLLCGLTTLLSGHTALHLRAPRGLLAAAAGVLLLGDAAVGRLAFISLLGSFPLTLFCLTIGLPLIGIVACWEIAARPKDAAHAREVDPFLDNLGLLPPALLLTAGALVCRFDAGVLLRSDVARPIWSLISLLVLLAIWRLMLHAIHSRLAYRALLARVRESERVAVTDPLTNLPNKRACMARLEDEVTRAARYKRSLSVIFVDVDFFKLVNDTHGHAAGDQALCAVAQTLRDRIRTTDMAARLGGEEFVIILPETTLSQAGILAERLRAAVEALQVPLSSGAVLHLTISLGIAAYPESSDTADALLQDADEAMGRAKESGRNRVMNAREKMLLFVYE